MVSVIKYVSETIFYVTGNCSYTEGNDNRKKG